jgi:hypothetical protein
MVALIKARKALKDERGVTVITFALVLPIFILVIFGMFEVWKIMSVRESLCLGMHRAAVYLTKEGRYLASNPGDWEDEAEGIIIGDIRDHDPEFFVELANNPFVPDNVDIQAKVHIDRPELPKCKWLFTATIEFPWTAVIPYIPLRGMTLVERTTSYIECTKYPIGRHSY